MIRNTFLLAALASATLLNAQERYSTRNGHISFHSDTPMEKIEAHNRKVTSVFDATTGALEFMVLIKAFEFEKALMQEHFNENYMDSNTHPKATFKGRITGIPEGGFTKPGEHQVTVEGDLTIKGVTKPVKATGIMALDPTGAVKAVSTFIVRPEDHDIKIPGVVRKNIAEEIEVKVDMAYGRM